MMIKPIEPISPLYPLTSRQEKEINGKKNSSGKKKNTKGEKKKDYMTLRSTKEKEEDHPRKKNMK